MRRRSPNRAGTVLAPLLAGLALAAPAHAASSKIEQEKLLNLGLFAGYVVACGFASEDEASAMTATLKEGFGELGRDDLAAIDEARATGRRTKCPDGPLKTAVERGWSNYKGAQYAPKPTEKQRPETPAETAQPPSPDAAPTPDDKPAARGP